MYSTVNVQQRHDEIRDVENAIFTELAILQTKRNRCQASWGRAITKGNAHERHAALLESTELSERIDAVLALTGFVWIADNYQDEAPLSADDLKRSLAVVARGSDETEESELSAVIPFFERYLAALIEVDSR